MKSPKSQTQTRQGIFSQHSATKSTEQTKAMDISAQSVVGAAMEESAKEMQIGKNNLKRSSANYCRLVKHAAFKKIKTRREQSLKQTMRKAETKFVAGANNL